MSGADGDQQGALELRVAVSRQEGAENGTLVLLRTANAVAELSLQPHDLGFS